MRVRPLAPPRGRWCLAGGLALGLLPRLAAAEATQPLQLVNSLVPADQCEYCHSFNNPPALAEEPMVAPVFTWRGSMMANSAVDPVFWAGVAIASQDAAAPEATEACIRCHSPRAFLEGRGDALSIDDLAVQDRFGVECESCHRMVADEPPGNGHYTIDDTPVGDHVPRRGPWSYPPEGPPPPPHGFVVDEFMASSQLCGTCHDVTTETERVDARGVGLGVGFNEQRTYSEWAGSALAVAGDDFRTCQDCHMPAVADVPGCRDAVMAGDSHPEGGRRHDLLGANRFVIELLAAEAGVFDAVAFQHSLTQLDEFVRTAATLEVLAPASVHLGEGLADLAVTVTNETGHKLPTGYSEGRVMWLEVVARMGDEVVWSSGAWDPGSQSFEDDPQLRTYQGVAVEQASGQRFHLLRNDYWQEDTRIPPRGLAPDPETDPVTDRYPVLPGGAWAHYDEHHYDFAGRPELEDPTPDDADDDALELSVRLLYLVNTQTYVQFLADENQTNEAGSELAMLFDTAGGATPVVLAEQTLSVPVSGFGEPEGSTTTGLDDTAGESGPIGTGDGATTIIPGGTGSETEGSPADDDGGSGCSCRSTAAPNAYAPWGLLLLAPWLRRRRNR